MYGVVGIGWRRQNVITLMSGQYFGITQESTEALVLYRTDDRTAVLKNNYEGASFSVEGYQVRVKHCNYMLFTLSEGRVN